MSICRKRLDHRILHVAGHKPLYDSDVLPPAAMRKHLQGMEEKERGSASVYAAVHDLRCSNRAYADELWITRIEQWYTGDTWFPAFCIGDLIAFK